ncbi:radical SAM family heme chaperone HemW [Croceimicrobium sp.]|uniref:radical SAM family heme chaperone HemW n=1 Tax=Croceimicrobium sp. TaxID=2828340 RepID=UPI003BA86EF1
MAGIYLHIPFCRQACVYCDFHFSTLHGDKEAMVEALIKEAYMRRKYMGTQEIKSIYFGGGTPSLLEPTQIQAILNALRKDFQWTESAEICLEANPDDLSEEFLEVLAKTEVNRLSIGLQSFKDEDLRLMNRAHSAQESRACLDLARRYGFTNLTVDLIYGIPNQSDEDWLWQLEQLKAYDIPHFSSYALTVEPKTVLAHWLKQGKVEVDESAAARHFKILQDFALAEGYEQYELSNFCRPGHQAVHNSSYWQGSPYLGLGPSAHSYNGRARHWNVANNKLYLKGIYSEGWKPEEELLTLEDRFNEFVMIRMRLKEGILIKELAGWPDYLQSHFWTEAHKLIKAGRLRKSDDRLFIPGGQRFFSDGIASDLFYLKED